MQTIRRQGKWSSEAMLQSYLMHFKTEGLLAMGGWKGAAQKR
jgi:hypothetical protein